MFMVNLGIQLATATMVGNQIGSSNVILAKKYFNTGSKISLCIGFIVTIPVYLNTGFICGLFTSEKEVLDLA